ncbi:MAG: flagellar biosynthesis anti-sigma factor FlgM [bacterium]
MSIEGVTSAQIIQKLKGIEQKALEGADKPGRAARADEVNISDNARLARTVSRVQEAIRETPDVRADRVAEVRGRLESGEYDSPEVIDDVAERMTNVFLGQ